MHILRDQYIIQEFSSFYSTGDYVNEGCELGLLKILCIWYKHGYSDVIESNVHF